MRGLGDSTQHELKVLGEQVVHTGGLARLAAGVANSSPLEVHPVAAGRLPVGPGAVPVACAEEITCLPRRASRPRRLCDTLQAIIAKDKTKHADFDAYELSSGRLVRGD